jgi:hypothetical protein
MKIQSTKNNLQSNAEMTSKDFGIGDPSVVIEILRNRLYAHPIRTLVQEYICNGRDAIRESGKQGRLVVNAPTHFEPTFKVRDYGVGISPERMGDVFVMYGASTKRTTNKQTGGFGIGAKSAWSYTDSFTIRTFVDGTLRVYVAHVGANSNGRLDLVETLKTDEANGTEIQIAVKSQDLRAFQDAVKRCIYFWNDKEKPEVKGLENLNNTVKGISLDGLELFKELPYFVNGNDSNGIIVVVDGIPYAIDSEFVNNNKDLAKFKALFNWQANIAVQLPNGVVEVSASREKLADSQRTRDALNALALKWTSTVKKHFDAEFKKAKTVYEFANTYRSFDSIFTREGMPTKFGELTVSNSALTCDLFGEVNMITVSEWRGKVTKTQSKMIKLETFDKVYFDDVEENLVQKGRRFREMLKAGTFTVVTNQKLEAVTDAITKVQTVKSVKKLSDKEFKNLMKELNAKPTSSIVVPDRVKAATGTLRMPKQRGTITIHKATYQQTFADVMLDTNTTQYLYASLEFSKNEIAEMANFIKKATGKELCRLSVDAIKKVKNDSNFAPLSDWLAKYKPTKEAIASLNSQSKQHNNIMEHLKAIKGAINVKKILSMIELYDANSKTLEIPEVIKKIIETHDDVKDFRNADKEFGKLIDDKYPLVKEIEMRYANPKIKAEVAWYVNNK